MRNLLLNLTLMFFSFVCGAQTLNTVSGIITDEKNEPLPFAQVWVKESKQGAVTNDDGFFSIKNIKLNNYHIVIRFVGYKEKILQIKNSNKNIRVKLNVDEKVLSAVICRANVNAIDMRERSGVVDVVRMSTLKDKPTIDLSVALQGAVPGLVIKPGEVLGEKPEIRIRGNSSLRRGNSANEPLYILDGKEITAEAFLLLNPIDIKSIKVLKDAAACAMYGIKAANGVIEITMDRGGKGKPEITFSTDIGITTRGPRPLKMMKTKEKLEYERLANSLNTPGYVLSKEYIDLQLSSDNRSNLIKTYNEYFGRGNFNTDQEIRDFAKKSLDSLKRIDTDWFKTLLRNTLYQNYYLSIKGGNDDVSYYSSISYSKQGGQLPGNTYDKCYATLGIDYKIGKLGYISVNTSGAAGFSENPNSSTFSLNSLMYNLNPYETKNSKHLFSYNQYAYKDLFNQSHSKSRDISASAGVSCNLQLLPDLHFDAVLGVDVVHNKHFFNVPSTSFEERKNGTKNSEKGRINTDLSLNVDFSGNARLTYDKIFKEKHQLTVSANYDYYYNNYELIGVTGYGTGTLDFLGATNMGIEGYRKPSFNSVYNTSLQFGIGSSVGYSYNSFYDLFATIKGDASSILPKNHRWHCAWALGSGFHWEKLLKWSFLNEFTTRFSYGYISNLSGVRNSETLPVYSYTNEYYDEERDLKMIQMYNPNLRPEETSSLEFGVGVGLWNYINMQIQLYRRYINDALLDVPIPSSMGFATMKKNIGELMNKGFEISLSSPIYHKNDLYINARGNMAYNNNMVISLYDKSELYESVDDIIPLYKEGEPYNLLWGWESQGINPKTGIPYLKDNNGNSKPLSGDMTKKDIRVLGRSEPLVNGSFGFSVTYKNFDADFQFYYNIGGLRPTSNEYIRDKDNANKNAPAGILNKTWFNPGDENKTYPSPKLESVILSNYNRYPNDRMVISTSMLKFSSFVIRYRLPENILKKYTQNMIKYLSFAVKGSNLFVLSPYSNGSPEALSAGLSIQPIWSFNTTINF